MKPTLIFLHGGPGFKDYLKPYFDELKSKYLCVFYDQCRGPQVTLNDLLHQLHVLVENSASKVILVGHSWGSILATAYAIKHESSLSGMVLMSTGLESTFWQQEFEKEIHHLELANAPKEKIFLSPEEMPNGKHFLDKIWTNFSQETFEQLHRTYLQSFDHKEAFKKMQLPVLNIYGEKDIRCPGSVSEELRSIRPEVINVEIANAGHFPFLIEENRKMIMKLIETHSPPSFVNTTTRPR